MMVEPQWDPYVEGWLIAEHPDGRAIWVTRFLYTHAIIVGRPDAGYYDDRWCYHTLSAAILAAQAWNPAEDAEPTGWHRHPATGRRRPGGNADLEVIAW